MSKRIYVAVLMTLALVSTASGASALQADEKTTESVGSAGSVGRSPLIEMTKALFLEAARASSTSEVLTLNLTNLIILLVVKAVIFGFGFVGVGRRSASSEPKFSEVDLMMMLSYSLGTASEDYGCLKRIACEEPEVAQQYSTASKMLLKGAKFFQNVVGYSGDYEDVVYGIQEAIEFRNNGGQCSEEYQCKAFAV